MKIKVVAVISSEVEWQDIWGEFNEEEYKEGIIDDFMSFVDGTKLDSLTVTTHE